MNHYSSGITTTIDPFTKEHTILTHTCTLAAMLQSVVDELLDTHPQWEGDRRITELVDAQRLSQLTNQLCACREVGWDS